MNEYKVLIAFSEVQANSPKDAAEQMITRIVDNMNYVMTDVTDSDGKHTTIKVDL